MIRSLSVGVTGLKTFQEALAITSNNIANSQTVGHKGQKASFEDLVYFQSRPGSKSTDKFAGVNPNDIGSGVKLSGVKTNLAQGAINNTGGKTDVAIEGNGYFMVGNANGDDVLYTRKGSFLADKYLTTEGGQYVLGWGVNPMTGKLDTTTVPKRIEIPMDQVIPGEATTKSTIKGNINYDTPIGESVRTQFPAYDAMGKRTDVTVEYVKTGNNTFRYVAMPSDIKQTPSIKNAMLNIKDNAADLSPGDYKVDLQQVAGNQVKITITPPAGSPLGVMTQTVSDIDQTVTLKNGTKDFMTLDLKKMTSANDSTVVTIGEAGDVSFDMTGKVSSITNDGNDAVPTISYISPASGQKVNIELTMNNLTLYATENGLRTEGVDGKAAAMIKDFSVTDDGIVVGQYSDGSIKELGQIAVAVFDNPQGLTRVGASEYAQTPASGEPGIARSGDVGAGRIRANSLENSNVDLSQEFVDLMVYQKAFQSNTKIIQVSDQVIDGIVNLIR